MIKYNLSYGFPQTWVTSVQEYEYAEMLYKKFFKNESNGLIVNLTWGGSSAIPDDHRSKYDQVLDIIKNKNPKKALFFNFVDDYDDAWTSIINQTKKKLGELNVKIVGHTSFKNDYPLQFWPLAVYKNFTAYSEEDIIPKEFKYRFLCYNRKPHTHRVQLVSLLNRKKYRGIVTLGKDNDSNDVLSFKSNGFSGKKDAFKIVADDTGIPNDLMSLGNLDIWNSSFLNIVSETLYKKTDYPFLTEKTFKPIVGMRPFLILGPSTASKWLIDNGFVHFNKEFNCSDFSSIHEIASAVKNLRNKNLKELYNKLYPKIKHNRDRFFEYCKEQEKLIYS